MPRPTPRQEDAQRRIHELLAELADIIGPEGDVDFEPGEGPTGKVALWEYAVVCCWLDDDRQDWVTIVPASGMLTHSVVGLLQTAARAHGEPL